VCGESRTHGLEWGKNPQGFYLSLHYTPPLDDLELAQRLWTELVENGEHINPVEYPNTPIGTPDTCSDVHALIASHLFCADNLCDDEIRARLAEERKCEGNPVKYDGQAFGNLYR